MDQLPDMAAEELRLTQQVAATQAVADQLRTELQKARIEEAVEVGQVELVDRASMPSFPVPAHRGLRILFGLIVGLALGCAGALLRENLNTAIRRREDIEQALHVPALAVIPQVTPPKRSRALARRNGNGTAEPQAGAGWLGRLAGRK